MATGVTFGATITGATTGVTTGVTIGVTIGVTTGVTIGATITGATTGVTTGVTIRVTTGVTTSQFSLCGSKSSFKFWVYCTSRHICVDGTFQSDSLTLEHCYNCCHHLEQYFCPVDY